MAGITEVKAFFAYTNITEFRRDWTQLSDEDKNQIRQGIGDGSLTY